MFNLDWKMARWQREVNPRATSWTSSERVFTTLQRKRASLAYTRLKRSRISGTICHQLESLELSPWTRSITRIPIAVYGVQFLAPHRNRKVFEVPVLGNLLLDSRVEHSGEQHSYVFYSPNFPSQCRIQNRYPAWQSKCYSRPERRGPPAAGPSAYITC